MQQVLLCVTHGVSITWVSRTFMEHAYATSATWWPQHILFGPRMHPCNASVVPRLALT